MAQAIVTRTADETVIRIKGPVSEKAMNLIRSAIELVEEHSQAAAVQGKRLPRVLAPLKPGAELVDDAVVDRIVQDISREIKAGALAKLKNRYLPDEPANS